LNLTSIFAVLPSLAQNLIIFFCLFNFFLIVNGFVNFSRIVYNDLQAIAPEQYFKQITKRLAEIKAVEVSLNFLFCCRDENIDLDTS